MVAPQALPQVGEPMFSFTEGEEQTRQGLVNPFQGSRGPLASGPHDSGSAATLGWRMDPPRGIRSDVFD
jgi:hypothetical protein